MTDSSSSDNHEELLYECALPDLVQIRGAVDKAWREAWADDPAVRAALTPRAGDEAPAIPFELRMTQGTDPLSVTLIVLAAHTGFSISKSVILDIFHRVILPKIERRCGEGTLKKHARRQAKR